MFLIAFVIFWTIWSISFCSTFNNSSSVLPEIEEIKRQIDEITEKMKADAEKYKGEKLELHTEEEAQHVIDSLDETYKVANVECKEKNNL